MSVVCRLTSAVARLRLPRRTVRLRITLLYGCLFLVSGAALLAATYLLVLNAVSPSPPANAARPSIGPRASAVAGARPDGVFSIAPGDQPGPGPQPEGPSISRPPEIATVMRSLFVNSWIALGIMLLISIALGWIIAGRILRPLRTITSSVQDISVTSLHRRLALGGPDDELQELGNTFDRLLGRLESSFRAQRQFVANASHELRTPLARQRALGQVALSDPDATAESLREAHERILVAGAQNERLIEALLTLTRGHAGIDVREPFDLASLTADLTTARKAEADHRGVALRPAIFPAIVAGHRKLTERLVANLLDNALKYNIPGGWVELSTGLMDGRPALVVSNTGPVVPPTAVDDLFQPFLRLGENRVAKGEGLGLGLSIVRAIADAHDATLATTARPDGGLTIRVTFPGAAPPGRAL